MANGDPITGHDLLLRRFNPASKYHWRNEGVEGAPRVIGSAFIYGADGFSVFNDATLISDDLHREVCLEDQSWGLVGLEADEIAALRRDGGRRLAVIEDAWPNGPMPSEEVPAPDEEPPSEAEPPTDEASAPDKPKAHARDIAHALIKVEDGTSNNMIQKWASKLARCVRPIPLDREP